MVVNNTALFKDLYHVSMPSKQSVIHTLTINGKPYLFFMEQEATCAAYNISCLNIKDLPAFRMTKEADTWRLHGDIPCAEQFEEKLSHFLTEHTAPHEEWYQKKFQHNLGPSYYHDADRHIHHSTAHRHEKPLPANHRRRWHIITRCKWSSRSHRKAGIINPERMTWL